ISMSFPRLDVIAGPDKGKFFVVHEGTGNMVGRHQDAFFRLNDPRVSRFHCELSRKGNVVTLKDNNGSGGTMINGAKVETATLSHRDTIQVGETLLRFFTHPDAAQSTVNTLRQHNADLDPEAVDQL